ncbi:gamma-glutamyltransferase [Bradyrhizobium japonicum]
MACRRARHGHQVRDAAAAGHVEGNVVAPRRRRSARFYQGDLAKSIASDIKADGGSLSVEDLAAFRAHLREPLAIPYRDGKVYATPELTAGPTMAHALRLLQQSLKPGSAPDATTYSEYALALQAAFRERLKDMGDADGKRSLGAEIWRPPAPRISPWSTATAISRRLRRRCSRPSARNT